MHQAFPTVRPDAYRERRERIRRAALEARTRDRHTADAIRAALRGPAAAVVAAEMMEAAR